VADENKLNGKELAKSNSDDSVTDSEDNLSNQALVEKEKDNSVGQEEEKQSNADGKGEESLFDSTGNGGSDRSVVSEQAKPTVYKFRCSKCDFGAEKLKDLATHFVACNKGN
jgi:hypothetical protein